jgi:hypothetical protein
MRYAEHAVHSAEFACRTANDSRRTEDFILNIDAALFPNAAPIDGQAMSDTSVLSGDSLGAELFSLVLATEAEKIMPTPNADFPANTEAIPLVGVAAPTEQTPDETPDAATPEKNPECPEGANYLLLLPFFAFSLNDPLWQNLPKRGNLAGQPDQAAPASDVVSMDPGSIEGLLAATAAAVPTTMALPCPPAEQQADSGPTESNLQATSRQQPCAADKGFTPVDMDTAVAKQSREIDSRPPIDIEIEKEEPSPEQVRGAIPSRSSEHSAGETRRPFKTRVVQSPDPEPQSNARSSNAPSPRVLAENMTSPQDVKVSTPFREGRVSQKEERLETAGPGATVEKPSELKTSPDSGNAVPATVSASHQGNTSGDPARQNRSEGELQIAVRRAVKDGPTSGQPVSQSRPELKSSQFALDLRSEGVSHDVVHHTGESLETQDPAMSPQSEHWSQIEKSNVISQLIEKARSLRWDRNTEIVVSLKPESLGRISMRAFLVDRTMVAMIATESDKVRQLIQLEIPAIQHSLHESGIPARVLVSHQTDINFDYNNAGNGQSRFRQNAPDISPDEVDTPVPANPEITDSRYGSHSVHLIA